MKIKKYTARTESEAITAVKDELGLDALILSIKKIQPKGFAAFLRKPQVEVTAAYDVKEKEPEKKPEPVIKPAAELNKTELKQTEPPKIDAYASAAVSEANRRIKALEESLDGKDALLGEMMNRLASERHRTDAGRGYENSLVQSFYETLTGRGVAEDVAERLLAGVAALGADEADAGLIARIVYGNILGMLGRPRPIATRGGGGCSIHFFMGPTGVGKTTTIAKISSELILERNVGLGLITADTYRIAAVEQLKTYAEILSVEVGVVYTTADFVECVGRMAAKYEMILVDTAGRSHKNAENLFELKELLDACPDAERHLVLSLATKYEDTLKIIEAYSAITDFDVIFTKLDETLELGSVLNARCHTGKQLSYAADGQNVPDDIALFEPEKIARALLGLERADAPRDGALAAERSD